MILFLVLGSVLLLAVLAVLVRALRRAQLAAQSAPVLGTPTYVKHLLALAKRVWDKHVLVPKTPCSGNKQVPIPLVS